MVDPWELLDRTANIIALLEVGGIAYAIYRKRDKLKQIAADTAGKIKAMTPPDVGAQLKQRRVHTIHLQAQSKAVASLTATPRVSREPPSALEELLAWYLRIASS